MFQVSTNFLVTAQMRDLSISCPMGLLQCTVVNPTDKERVNHTSLHWFSFLLQAKNANYDYSRIKIPIKAWRRCEVLNRYAF